MIIWSDKVLVGHRLIEAAISVQDGLIKGVKPGACPQDVDFNLEGLRVIPGLIDVHIHGCAGSDTMDASYTSINNMSKYLAVHGVTSFVPTTITSSVYEVRRALANVADAMDRGCAGAKVLGSSVEGPFFSPEYCGAHMELLLEDITIERVEKYLEVSRDTVLNITIAPELTRAPEVIQYLRSKKINVSIGHSGASFRRAMEAVVAGANRITHIYNGMPPMHHRETGVLGAALLSDTYAEMICDRVHVDAPAAEIALRCKGPEKIVLVSDCISAGGMLDGSYTLGSVKVQVKDGVARIASEETLAGSTLSLDRALANYIYMTGEPFERAVFTATANAADSLGIDDRGRIEPGKCADIIAVDDDIRPLFVMIDGGVYRFVGNQ